MARRPQKVKVNGVDIIDVLSLEISVGTNPNELGLHRERTKPVHVRIVRDASQDPTLGCFNSLIAEDGGARATAEFTIVTDVGKDAYVWKLNKAYISEWRIDSPGRKGDAFETIEIYAGDVQLSAGSDTVTFALNDFNPK